MCFECYLCSFTQEQALNTTMWEVFGCNPRQHIWKCQMNTSVFHSNLLLWRFLHVSFKQTVLLPYKILGAFRAWVLLWTENPSEDSGRILIEEHHRKAHKNQATWYRQLYVYIFTVNHTILLSLVCCFDRSCSRSFHLPYLPAIMT